MQQYGQLNNTFGFNAKLEGGSLIRFFLFFLAPIVAVAQMPQGGVTASVAGAGVSTTAVVTHAQGPSTENNVVSSLVSGTATCAAYTICFALPDAVLSGNGVAVAYRYGATSAETATVTDDQSNTYSCITEVRDATHNQFMGGCYSLNLTNSPRVIKVTLNSGCGASGCTNGQVEAAQLYNVTSFDTSATGSNTGSVTALSTSALTTSATFDLIYHAVAITNPSNTSSTNNSIPVITFAGGWTGVAADRRDGISAQWEAAASAGSVTPTETAASGVSYLSVAMAFRSGNQGTLPSGEYVVCRGDFNSKANDTQTTVPMQIPCGTAGNLIFSSVNGGVGGVGGHTPAVTSVTDASNTWSKCIASYAGSAVFWAEGWCAYNATISNTEAPTFNINWATLTGADVSFWWYVISGASTISSSNSLPSDSTLGSAGSQLTGVASLNVITGYQPQNSTGLTAFQYANASNTVVAQSSPCTNIDTTINGGENLSGPWQQDQNNSWGHCLNSSSNATQTWTVNYTSSSQAPGAWQAELISFPASTALWTPQHVVGTGTSVTDIVINITTLSASDSLVVPVGFYNGGSITITKVCLDGNANCTTGAGLTQFTEFVNARSTSTASQGGTGVWYLLSGISKAAHTVTIVASGSANNLEGTVFEVTNITATDVAGHTNNGSVASAKASGPSITTTGNPGFAVAIFSVSQGCTATPAAGNEYTAGGGIFANTNDGYMSLVSTTAAAHSPACSDASGTFNSSNAAFK